MISKSYRAALPIGPSEAERLRLWSEANCAATEISREGDCYIWSATRERARTREAFMRSVRATLLRLAIDTSRLRGCWLVLATDCSSEARVYTPAFTPARPPALVPTSAPPPEEGDEKVVVLSGPRNTQGGRSAGAPRGALQVYKV